MQERIKDLGLLFVLLTVSVVTMLSSNAPLVRGLRSASLSLTERVEQGFSWMGNVLNAVRENERLREENIRLSSEVARSREARVENERLRRLLGLRDTTAYPLLPARILSKNLVRRLSTFVIDVGAEDGVEPDMAVIDSRGILGRVTLVAPHTAEVMTYFNTDFFVPARVQPVQVDGIVHWEGEQYQHLLLELVVKTEPVASGQHVVTSGYSGIFPPGLPIGVVDSVRVQSGQDALFITVRPSAPLHTATHVFVVKTHPTPER